MEPPKRIDPGLSLEVKGPVTASFDQAPHDLKQKDRPFPVTLGLETKDNPSKRENSLEPLNQMQITSNAKFDKAMVTFYRPRAYQYEDKRARDFSKTVSFDEFVNNILSVELKSKISKLLFKLKRALMLAKPNQI